MGSSCPCFSSLGLANGGKKAKKKKKSQAFGSKDRAMGGPITRAVAPFYTIPYGHKYRFLKTVL